MCIVAKAVRARQCPWRRCVLASTHRFSTVCPTVLPFVLFHLIVCYFVFGRALLYSQSRGGWVAGKADGGQGLMWPSASRWLLTALVCAQLILIALHSAQTNMSGAIVTTFFVVPLVPLTVYAQWYVFTEFEPQLRLLPMNRCAEEDDAEAKADAERGYLKDPEAQLMPPSVFAPDTYLQTELCAETWEKLRAGAPPPAKSGEWVQPPPCERIAVLGSTGGVGRHVVRLALEAGHTVIALARDPKEVEPKRHRRLRKFPLDLTTGPAELALLLRGCTAVISCLGNRRGEPKIVHAGTRTLLAAMMAAGVPRMSMLSCVGVGDSEPQLCAQARICWRRARASRTGSPSPC